MVVPARPVETGVAEAFGPLHVEQETRVAAEELLAQTLSAFRAQNLTATGRIGDQQPTQALADGVASFRPDQIVIATPPLEDSIWHRYNVVDRARVDYTMPVTHVIAAAQGANS